jgi:ATP-dependent RNA helicase DDX51/DBP6
MSGLPSWLANPVRISVGLDESSRIKLGADDAGELDPRLNRILTEQGVSSLFPVQDAVLRHIQKGSDLCVAAPTGSGKTLAYILPIIQSLHSRRVVRLRALIVVPGRELAAQVLSVMEPLATVLGLTVGVAVGQTSFSAEQRRIIDGEDSRVDILVATPGRLIDHLDSGLSLKHLQWLVLDEADRLLEDVGQDVSWLPLVFAKAYDTSKSKAVSFRRPEDCPANSTFWVTPLRKMLFSATLTRNPAKLASLDLHRPIYICVADNVDNDDDDGDGDADTLERKSRYQTPAELAEFMHVCEEDRKPVALVYLLEHVNITRSLCFTRSVEATDKLCRLLLQCTTAKKIASFSGDLSSIDRAKVLDRFNAGEIDLLICSDAAARGLDLADVGCVINYDAPKHAKTYIHRVGRTARAGKKGTAYTLLAIREAHHFKEMLGKAGKSKLPSLKIPKTALSSIIPVFEEALQSFRDV